MDEGLFLDCMSRKNHIITIITIIIMIGECQQNKEKTCKIVDVNFFVKGLHCIKNYSIYFQKAYDKGGLME